MASNPPPIHWSGLVSEQLWARTQARRPKILGQGAFFCRSKNNLCFFWMLLCIFPCSHATNPQIVATEQEFLVAEKDAAFLSASSPEAPLCRSTASARQSGWLENAPCMVDFPSSKLPWLGHDRSRGFPSHVWLPEGNWTNWGSRQRTWYTTWILWGLNIQKRSTRFWQSCYVLELLQQKAWKTNKKSRVKQWKLSSSPWFIPHKLEVWE